LPNTTILFGFSTNEAIIPKHYDFVDNNFIIAGILLFWFRDVPNEQE
jgi:hypothetical protein